jgi:hypothetical protein
MNLISSTNPAAPYAAATKKIVRQPASRRMKPPRAGAIIGATIIPAKMLDRSRAAESPLCRSKTSVRGMTMDAAPPNAASARHA